MKVKWLILSTLFLIAVPLFSAAETKQLQFLDADKVLTVEQLKGQNYQVDQTVRNDGLLNYYIINADFGRTSAQGTAELETRITELNALVAMEKIEGTEVFKNALVKGVKGVGEGVVELVKSPIETSKEIAKGTGQFFSNVGQAFVSDDPDQDNAMKVAIGYDVAKRQFAYEFGINPYTDYGPVTDRLGEIAQAATAGGLTPKVALTAIGGGIATVARVSGTMRGMQLLVRDNPPSKLREINAEKLRSLGLSAELAERFIDNYVFDPYEKTLLVGELESMKVPGTEIFIARANLVKQKSMALLYRTMAQMMGEYHRNVESVKAISGSAGVLNLVRKDGGRVVLMPLDYVFWTENVASKVEAFDLALQQDTSSGKKEFWVTGRVDPTAKSEFEKRGWLVVEDANSRLLKK